MIERVVFINVTRQCNVDCHRCYLTPAHRASPERLAPALLECLFASDFCQHADRLTLVWEGGELTLLGEAYLQEVTALAARWLPRARQTMVTNLYHFPDWLARLAWQRFAGAFDTTFALAGKAALNGDEALFQRRFHANLCRAAEAGLDVAVNVELNRETVAAGPGALAQSILASGNRCWEFDLSVDFERFLREPVYNAYSYPLLTSTVSYQAVSSFVLALMREHGEALRAMGFHSTLVDQPARGADSEAFNVCQELNFVTLNPDGTVTTNPLFSDLEGTYLGNLHNQSLAMILDHPNRRRRARYELLRKRPCHPCPFVQSCGGGPSHVPVMDDSGVCAGMKPVWEAFSAAPVLEREEV